jgi:hypothetical protein
MAQTDILQSILKDSNYNLSLFSAEEIEALREKVFTKEARGKENGGSSLFQVGSLKLSLPAMR